MRILPNHLVRLLCCAALLTSTAGAATKVHVITFGKWTSAQWFAGGTNDKAVIIKIRALVIDGRVKEYVLGAPHEVTDRLFVVRRVFRVNDSLPEDSGPRWQWQRGGWLLVDRATGHISPINLPEFDAYYSAASWYRDYVAYCGVADDGKKTYAMVAQLSRRKPVLKKALSNDGVPEVLRLRAAVAARQAENARVAERNRQLAAEVHDLKQGYSALEERARSDLGMIASDETFYQVVPGHADADGKSPTRTAAR